CADSSVLTSDRRDRHALPTRRSSDLADADLVALRGELLARRVADAPADQTRRVCQQIDDRDVAHRRHRVIFRRRTAETAAARSRSEEHTSALQSRENIVCRLLLAKTN